jgi:RimJ/RimL family protein N-acetyltransferase
MVATQEVRKRQTTIHLEPVQHSRETLAKWIEWINDPKIRQWMYSDLPQSPEDINQWLYNATHDPRRHYFSIIADGNLIGFVSLRQDQKPESTGEIGIVIGDKSYQSRGIGTATVTAVTQFAKDVVGLTSVRAMIKPENEKSIRLFHGAGFTQKGTATINDVHMLRFEKQL